MTILIRVAALALALAAAPAARAETLCDSLKTIVAAMDASPMFSGIARAENNRPVGKIVPEGWVRCTIGQYEETTGRYTCYAPGGKPQATQLAHLAEIHGEIARCFGATGALPTGHGLPADEFDFVIRRGDPTVTIETYTEGAGTPEGGIRLQIEFTHPS